MRSWPAHPEVSRRELPQARAGAPPPHNHSIDEKQDDRADDRREPGRDVEEVVQWVGVEESAGKESTEESANDADDGGNDESAWVIPRKQRLRDRPREQTENDERNDAHEPSCRFAKHSIGTGTPVQRHEGRSRYGFSDGSAPATRRVVRIP